MEFIMISKFGKDDFQIITAGATPSLLKHISQEAESSVRGSENDILEEVKSFLGQS